MAFGVNKVILVGRLGKDPEIKFMPSGSAVANFSLATSEKWKDKETGDMKESTEWHNLVAYGKVAEIISEHTNKGMSMYVEGQLKTRKWQDKSGKDHYSTDVVVRDFIIHSEGGQRSAPQAKTATNKTTNGKARPAPEPDYGDDEFQDKIPF